MPPASLRIELTTRGRLPDDTRDVIVLDFARGIYTHSHWSDQMGSKPKTQRIALGHRAEGRIRKAVARSTFFRLRSRTSKVLDGDLVQVGITLGDKTNTVLSLNSTHKQLDRLVSSINAALPVRHRIWYTSLSRSRSSFGR